MKLSLKLEWNWIESDLPSHLFIIVEARATNYMNKAVSAGGKKFYEET